MWDSRPVQSVKPKWALAGVAGLTLLAAVLSTRTAFASSDAKKQGQELFATKGCAHCHGPNGVGGGKGPDLQLVRTRRSRESTIMQIHDGGQQMPSFGDELSAQEIEELLAFLRAEAEGHYGNVEASRDTGSRHGRCGLDRKLIVNAARLQLISGHTRAQRLACLFLLPAQGCGPRLTG